MLGGYLGNESLALKHLLEQYRGEHLSIASEKTVKAGAWASCSSHREKGRRKPVDLEKLRSDLRLTRATSSGSAGSSHHQATLDLPAL